MKPSRFNIRVYGIYINEFSEVLITDEIRKGMKMSKFPGGGLEFGEGILDCLKRECFEETNQEFEVLEHFYTTDFFIASAFNPAEQLISIYYLVRPIDPIGFELKKNVFEFNDGSEQSFRMVRIALLDQEDLTFPVDKMMVERLKTRYL